MYDIKEKDLAVADFTEKAAPDGKAASCSFGHVVRRVNDTKLSCP
jgi:hypothetical protein